MKQKVTLLAIVLPTLLVVGVVFVYMRSHGARSLTVTDQKSGRESSGEQMMSVKTSETSTKMHDDAKSQTNDLSNQSTVETEGRTVGSEENVVHDAMQKAPPSIYENYTDQVLQSAMNAQKSGRKVVLFFHASWCPFCVAADKEFRSSINTSAFPENTTLVKVDFDTSTNLKKKYGVTYQHTFVQVDSNGNLVTKWVSGQTPELATHVQ